MVVTGERTVFVAVAGGCFNKEPDLFDLFDLFVFVSLFSSVSQSNIFNSLTDDSFELNPSITAHALKTNELLDLLGSMCVKYQRFSVAISKQGTLLHSILLSLVRVVHTVVSSSFSENHVFVQFGGMFDLDYAINADCC